MEIVTGNLPPLRSVKVLDQLRERIRYLHYSIRTERDYVHWVRAYIRFHGLRHPATLGGVEVEGFLSWLGNERRVSASTHRQALAALLFFYGKVLCVDLPWMNKIGWPRQTRRLPVVLAPEEVARVLSLLEGEHRLFAQLLHGTGMRISEGLQLRVKDLDFDHATIVVREGKGSKDRAPKCCPNAWPRPCASNWFGRDCYGLLISRRAVAVWRCQTRWNENFLGHSDVATTMIYTHVLKVGGAGVRSPMDALPPA